MCSWERWSWSSPGGRNGKHLPYFRSIWDTLRQFSMARGPALPENSFYWLTSDVQTSGVARLQILRTQPRLLDPGSFKQGFQVIHKHIRVWKVLFQNSSAVQWLELCTSNAGSPSSIPAQGNEDPACHVTWKFFFKCCSKESSWEISSNTGVLHTEPYLKTSVGKRISKHLSLRLANFCVSFKTLLNISLLAIPFLISDNHSLLLPTASYVKFYHFIYHIALQTPAFRLASSFRQWILKE